jgi:formate dehydrogenase
VRRQFAKVVSVLYDDPITGYPTTYSRSSIPSITRYPDGQTTPNPKKSLGQEVKLYGSVSGELGLRDYLESLGHEYVVTSDKDGVNAELEKHLPDAEVIISQPFWPAYMTAERIAKAPNLKMLVTAGIGSDHVDLEAACANNITVVEVSFVYKCTILLKRWHLT